ncbi:hypothetical protein ACFUIY_10280 [Streptomyces griseorubiginosus]|uniref:hypothetical protein n=1 Tax=Streptomyces griseorubiginosus TaxID=67304 RepID=UPI003633347F
MRQIENPQRAGYGFILIVVPHSPDAPHVVQRGADVLSPRREGEVAAGTIADSGSGMAPSSEELKTSRYTAAFPAWMALAGVVLTAILSGIGTYIGTTLSINAEKSNRDTQRQEQLEDRQRE